MGINCLGTDLSQNDPDSAKKFELKTNVDKLMHYSRVHMHAKLAKSHKSAPAIKLQARNLLKYMYYFLVFLTFV